MRDQSLVRPCFLRDETRSSRSTAAGAGDSHLPRDDTSDPESPRPRRRGGGVVRPRWRRGFLRWDTSPWSSARDTAPGPCRCGVARVDVARGFRTSTNNFARHARAPRDVVARVDSFPPLTPSARASISLSPDAGVRRRAREPSAAARGRGAGSFPRVPHALRARRTPRHHLLRARRPSNHRRVAPTRVHRPSTPARPRLRGGARLVPPTRRPRRAPARASTPGPRHCCAERRTRRRTFERRESRRRRRRAFVRGPIGGGARAREDRSRLPPRREFVRRRSTRA